MSIFNMTYNPRLDSDNEDTPRSSSNKKERFFWQYNVQAKGPKGQRLVIKSQLEDPHVLNEITDPVFSPNCSVRGIKVIKVFADFNVRTKKKINSKLLFTA